MPSWLTILVAGIAVHWIAIEARAERAKRKGEITLYRAPLGLRVLFGLALPAMVYGAGTVALSHNFNQDWWVSALLFAMAVLCAWHWPSDLGVSNAGIYEQKWFGLRKESFRWEEIASAMASPSDDSVSIVSKSGVTIKNTTLTALDSLRKSEPIADGLSLDAHWTNCSTPGKQRSRPHGIRRQTLPGQNGRLHPWADKLKFKLNKESSAKISILLPSSPATCLFKQRLRTSKIRRGIGPVTSTSMRLIRSQVV